MDRRLERSGKGKRKVKRESILEAQERGGRQQVAHQGLVCRMGLQGLMSHRTWTIENE
jgi:hypothetical protein